MKILSFVLIFSLLFLINLPKGECSQTDKQNSKVELPQLDIDNVVYQGAFRLPVNTYGDSRMAYSQGTFTLSEDGNSIFVIGHEHHQAIAELSVPQILVEKNITKLHMSAVRQPFSRFLGRATTGNIQGIDKVTGMEHINGQLIVNGVRYYDGPGNVSDTTLIVRTSSDLVNSKVDGYFKTKGRAHAAGWISPVPAEWSAKIGAELLTGFASNYAINSRNSIGPTAFAFFPLALLDSDEKKGFIYTEQLLGYSMKNPLHSDRYNSSGKNDLWTEVSTAMFGFIVPGTSTYLVIGNSGGHNSGIGYKITQDNGHLCGGPCSKKRADNYNYYWTWDVQQMLEVVKGNNQPYNLKPTKFGVFDRKRKGWKLIGADFDATRRLLFVMYAGVDRKQSKFEGAPLMVVYKVSRNMPAN